MLRIRILLFLSALSTSLIGQEPFYNWVVDFGAISGQDQAYDMATDDDGNVYITGLFWGTVDFDPGAGTSSLTSAGNADIFVLKLNSNGSFEWAKRIGNTLTDEAQSICLDQSGNILLGGFFAGTVDFDPGSGTYNMSGGNSTNPDGFVLKLTHDGNFIWAKQVSGFYDEKIYDVTTDANNNVYATGSFNWSADFDPGTSTVTLNTNGSSDAFILKLNSSGEYSWAKNVGGSSGDLGRKIVVDNSGNVYSSGNFQGTADFDPNSGTSNMTSNGSQDVYVLRLSSTGTFDWVNQIGGAGYELLGAIYLDENDNLYTSGNFEGTVDFDPGNGIQNITAINNENDMFLQKVSSNGTLLWIRTIGAWGNDGIGVVSLGFDNDVYLTGYYDGSINVSTTNGVVSLDSNGYSSMFLARLNASGDFIWAKSMGGTAFNHGHSLSIQENFDVYIAGRFSGNSSYEPGNGNSVISTSGPFDNDNFILKLTQCQIDSTSQQVSECESYTWTDGNTYTSSGIYSETYTNQSGCDSVATLDLTINEYPDVSLTTTDSSIIADFGGLSQHFYTWLDCDDGYGVIFIDSNGIYATGESFVPLETGSYAVRINNSGCVDTSECMPFTVLSVENKTDNGSIELFPNPTAGEVFIDSDVAAIERIEIHNLNGQLIRTQYSSIRQSFYLDKEGIYFVSIYTDKGIDVQRIIVN